MLWEKYEQLHRDLAPSHRPGRAPSHSRSRTQTPNQPPAALAWQRTDRYVPPDPNGFFPDDPEAGKKLDVLFRAGDRDRRLDEEILSTARRGFRRTTHSHNSVLQWIGNHFIWGKQPQNPEAIEIMYHAVPLERHYAICSGLSVVKNKSPNILYTLAAICMQGEEVGRITWGIGTQREATAVLHHAVSARPGPRETGDGHGAPQALPGRAEFRRAGWPATASGRASSNSARSWHSSRRLSGPVTARRATRP